MRRLSPRERQVAGLICAGHSNKIIADVLGISEHTAKYHVYNVCRKYDTTSRVVVAVAHTMATLLKTHTPKHVVCVPLSTT
jgi:two-component system nitrate/nitrite response regulator NarL